MMIMAHGKRNNQAIKYYCYYNINLYAPLDHPNKTKG